MSGQASVSSIADFERLLHELTGFDVPLSDHVKSAVTLLIAAVGGVSSLDRASVERRFYGRVNMKLDANRDVRRSLFADAANAGFTFNFPQKKEISRKLDECDKNGLAVTLASAGVPGCLSDRLIAGCQPVSPQVTRDLIYGETVRPSKLRKAMQRAVEEDVFASCAGPLAWALWPVDKLYKAFGGGGDGETARDYMGYLASLEPELFNRNRTLAVRFIDPVKDRVSQRADVSSWLASEYNALANHGFVALVVNADPGSRAWQVVNDATLFGERFQEVRLRQLFFRRAEVRRQTLAFVENIDPTQAQFDVLNEGFTYRDVFVLTTDEGIVKRLVLVMQKNKRDETRIPCPACRGGNIEGNSYPVFGVRSWECRNALCPNRSIYNRGNRFQFRSIVQRAAIEDPRNTISVESVNRWRKDVVRFESDTEIAQTMVDHYSIAGDGVVINGPIDTSWLRLKSRVISSQSPPTVATPEFWTSSFFNRFVVPPTDGDPVPASEASRLGNADYAVLEGDSTQVLKSFAANSFDRAITSPPYYNAREYAQWPNLYCYLYDMYLNSLEVFRTLKPGALYAYNIFDYFDNENVVTFSAMGQKRIPLGALMSDIFERIGFEVTGVVPWDKGDIQGKRGFNGGNYSPYYQSPFNCWEHVILAKKPTCEENADLDFPPALKRRTARIPPVFKMVRGQNTYGHTAPYPEALAEVLLAGLKKGAVVLDPYAGSGTTARAGIGQGVRTILVERDAEYAALARKMTDESLRKRNGLLF